MIPLYSIEELQCLVFRLSYKEWLEVKEPVIFEEGNDDACQWQLLPQNSGLTLFTNHIALIKVDDKFYKFTGKRRKNLWQSGEIEPPNELVAFVFTLSKSEFLALNKQAKAKKIESLPVHEQIKLIYANLGLDFKSDRLRNGFINEAINIALRGKQRAFQDKRTERCKEEINMKKAIALFAQELQIIDNLNPKADIFQTGVFSGALIMLGIYPGNKLLEDFLLKLNDYQGTTKDVADDPIECLLKTIHRFRITPRNQQPRMAIDLCGKTLQAIEIWLEGSESPRYWRKRDLTGNDPENYIRSLKKIKQITGAMDL